MWFKTCLTMIFPMKQIILSFKSHGFFYGKKVTRFSRSVGHLGSHADPMDFMAQLHQAQSIGRIMGVGNSIKSVTVNCVSWSAEEKWCVG
jgi:hypothetical protein